MQQYQKNTRTVIDYLVTVGRRKGTISIYKACYQSLGDALEQEGVPYSTGFASLWLDQQCNKLEKTAYDLYKAALHKLDDVYLTGDIQHDRFNPDKTKLFCLNECYRELVSSFLSDNNTLSPASVKDYTDQFCDILIFLQDMGCSDTSDISYKILFNYCGTLESRTYHVRALKHSRLNSLLCFLYKKGQAPFGYTLFVAGFVRRKHFWDSLNPEIIVYWQKEQSLAKNTFSLEDFLNAGDTVYEIHKNCAYSKGYLSSIHHAVIMFYLFMDMNSLKYVPERGILWADSLKPHVSSTQYTAVRRTMIMVGQVSHGITINLKAVFSTRMTAQRKLPSWCSAYVRDFLNERKAENMAPSTICMMNSCCCRFCLFLDQIGITSFSQVSILHIKRFNLSDVHKTPAGKNAYNSRIRRFLIYLAERGALSNPFLFLALPCVSAPKETLVVVLSRQEQDELRRLFDTDGDDITLRQKAMLQLGLYMGLRGIDIINLTIGDIDWEDVSIRFVQEKTGYELYLPMPSDVANALYRYIVRERPVSDNPRVFLRSKAPYCELRSKTACAKALRAALPGRNVEGSGFHVTRKTFATTKLRGGAHPDEVKELLGHKDRANLHKYLSLDEGNMRLCCMDLSERSIRMEGRFCR